eukprot:10888122-Ditylum_brightwellii.AAC.1
MVSLVKEVIKHWQDMKTLEDSVENKDMYMDSRKEISDILTLYDNSFKKKRADENVNNIISKLDKE